MSLSGPGEGKGEREGHCTVGRDRAMIGRSMFPDVFCAQKESVLPMQPDAIAHSVFFLEVP